MEEREKRLVRAHIRAVQESVAEYEESAKENGELPTLEGYKLYLERCLSDQK